MNGWTDEKIIELIRSRLKPDRFLHSLNVADSARTLARQYGCDENKAYTAGLLHDVMKNASGLEQLEAMDKAGLKPTKVELANPKLWHAMAGACYVKTEMGIDDEEIFLAVRYHTTGRAGMTLLEKIIYLADFISSERDYPGVDEMRELCQKSTDDAVIYALEFCIPNLVGNRQIIHPDSIDLYNEKILTMRGQGI